MPRIARRVCGALSALLVCWMVYVLFAGPVFEFEEGYGDDDKAFTMRCEPLIWRNSWYETWHASAADGRVHPGYTITEGEEPRSEGFDREDRLTPEQERSAVDREIEADLNEFCTNARSGQAGVMALTAVPAALLGAAALVRRPGED
jgi:hypothetical protein